MSGPFQVHCIIFWGFHADMGYHQQEWVILSAFSLISGLGSSGISVHRIQLTYCGLLVSRVSTSVNTQPARGSLHHSIPAFWADEARFVGAREMAQAFIFTACTLPPSYWIILATFYSNVPLTFIFASTRETMSHKILPNMLLWSWTFNNKSLPHAVSLNLLYERNYHHLPLHHRFPQW